MSEPATDRVGEPTLDYGRGEAVVDLAAIGANVDALRDRLAPGAKLMAVVKADAYGHGLGPVARTVVEHGAVALGVATLSEGLAAQALGLGVPVIAWLWTPQQDPGPAVAAGVHLGVSSRALLDALLATPDAGGNGHPIPVHLKVDTGLGRNGAVAPEWPDLFAAAAAAELAGRIAVVGLMSHFASADVPDDPSVAGQTSAFRAAIDAAQVAGLRPRWRHLANTPAVLDHPDTHFDLVRAGIGVYGISPVEDPGGLRPAMTLRSRVALTKRVPADSGVSYGLTYRTSAETTLALVPLGYADGIPRHASNAAEVLLRGKRRRIAGRVAMDQFVVDVGDDDVRAGDEVVLFGPGDRGEPTADEWAAACGTISYEIVTRISPRVPRRYVGG